MMALKTYNKKITLFNDANYNVSVELDGISCIMYFVWNQKTQRFHATLVKQDGTEVFVGVQINSLSLFPLHSSMAQNGFLGTFVLSPLDEATPETADTYRNWANYFVLMYQINVEV